MMLLDKTSERLRTKHVRTLELLQKTLDENVELRDRIGQMQKGTLHLSQGVQRSNRTNELEDEIDRLKAEHCAKMLATEEAARVRHDELVNAANALQVQQQKLQNEVFTLETRLYSVRETLQSERQQWQLERQRLQNDNRLLQQEAERLGNRKDDHQERHQAELSSLERELDQHKQQQLEAEDRNRRLQHEIVQLCAELKHQKDLLTSQQTTLDKLQLQVSASKGREETLIHELETLRDRNNDLQTKVNHMQALSSRGTPAPTEQQQVQHLHQQYTTVLTQLHEMEEQTTRVVGENRALQDTVTKLQAQVAESTRASSGTGSVFATHIDLKRENFHLRSQVEEMKQLQRRYLTTAKKKTMNFPAI